MAKRVRLGESTPTTPIGALERFVTAEEINQLPVEEIPMDRIRANPRQPRHRDSRAFASDAIKELASSISVHGVLQPILVKDTGRHFQIIAGERRYRACRHLGLASIPARILAPETEQDELEISLVENLQRRDLDPLEEAHIYRQMIDELGYTYRSLAEKIGKSLGYVDTRMKILSHEDITTAVQQLNIGVAEARDLAKIEDATVRGELLRQLREGEVDRLAFRAAIGTALGRPPKSRPAAPAGETPEVRLRALLDEAVQIVDHLEDPTRLREDPDTLQLVRSLFQLIAPALGLGVTTPRMPPPLPPVAPRAPEPTAAPSARRAGSNGGSVTARQAIHAVKDWRDSGGMTAVSRVLGYWRTMERRGHSLQLGAWDAEPLGDDIFRITLGLKVDGRIDAAEWRWDHAHQTLTPLSDPAREILGVH